MQENLPLVERILTMLGGSLQEDFQRYRNHVYRVIRLTEAFLPALEEEERALIQVAAAWHQAGIWQHKTLDYLEPSADHASAWLAQHLEVGTSSLAYKQRLVRQMILNQYRLRPCRQTKLVEAFRKAVWSDLLGDIFRFGLPRAQFRSIRQAFPIRGYQRRGWALAIERCRHFPFSPLPMLRW
ncbi:phosphohydrolase [Mangrovitalea sediminis]|uniref:phosphohydrolase n=1 Tax=Mangrovitalea sediminis TaxID=1982043 RepID=UPI000BE4B2F1|nr:phosphohydrolase [Mangrovitalea sediminis]